MTNPPETHDLNRVLRLFAATTQILPVRGLYPPTHTITQHDLNTVQTFQITWITLLICSLAYFITDLIAGITPTAWISLTALLLVRHIPTALLIYFLRKDKKTSR